MLSISFEGEARTGRDGADAIDGLLTSGNCAWDVTLGRA